VNRFHELQVFVAVAEEQGFAPAARRLQSSPPAVTRAVAALEKRLGIKLVERTTRYVRVTEAGLRYLEDARQILADLETADEAATGINAEPKGHVAITAPVLFGRQFVMPVILDYLRDFPETDVSAIFFDRIVNLMEEGIDVGVRIGELPDSSMRALKVGFVRHVLCASPEYLDKAGVPQNLEALARHNLIASSAGSHAPGWRFRDKDKEITVRVKPRLSITTNDAAVRAAVDGFGITRLLSYQASNEVDSGKLRIVLQEFEPATVPIHVLHREGRYSSAKIRTLIDMLGTRLRASKALNTESTRVK